jgi:hypothetical protein
MKTRIQSMNHRTFVARGALAAIAAPCLASRSVRAAEPAKLDATAIRIAVVTGGHSFDVLNFHKLFRTLSGVDACIQHVDETYTMADAGKGSDILFRMDHPQSMKTIGWTRQFKKSRVFCTESGHDNQTWANPSFWEVLLRGIRGCARKI